MDLPIAQRALIHGDALSQCIAAASILAKVERDACMREWDRVFPQYGLKNHKGYSTDEHWKALETHGPTLDASLQLLAGARACAARSVDRLSAPSRPVSGRRARERAVDTEALKSQRCHMRPVEPQRSRRRGTGRSPDLAQA